MRCRLCQKSLSGNLLKLENFPKAAQYFPKPSEFEDDTGVTLSIVQCDGCGLTQLENAPVAYYKEVITAASLSISLKKDLTSRFMNIREKYNLFGKRTLEVGCGRGEVVTLLKELGFDAHGLEYSSANVAIAKENKIELARGYIIDGYTSDHDYDFFICLNYLEHQPAPVKFLQSIKRHLSKSALGYVTVPNLDFLMQNSALHEFVSDHLVYFTKQTLRTAFEISGFEILELDLVNNENDISALVRKRDLLDVSKHLEKLNRTKTNLKESIDKICSNGQKVAIWGAGHRALALMSLSGLDNISLIIDSAPFKQGRYSPLLHKEIIGPDQIEARGLRAIVVMLPGNFAHEVVDLLKKKHKNIDVYVFDETKVGKV